MELLRELMRIQHEVGWISNERLVELGKDRRVPLYRLEELVSFYPHFRRTKPPRTVIRVCRDAVCRMAGCQRTIADIEAAISGRTDIELQQASCLGRCDQGPAVSINNRPCKFHSVSNLLGAKGAESLRGTMDGNWGELGKNVRRWRCDPYPAAEERFQVVRRLWSGSTRQPDPGEYCIQQLQAAGLRGMGGAGFPTGRKWALVRSSPSEPKYVICNADESEPGTFKDRVILDELPHLVIEGMLAAGLTVGAERGIVYLRHEYSLEQRSLETALAAAKRMGVLGDNAAGSGRPFDIEIFVSPGGYILGEETALLEALEDRRGEPRNKPPYPGTNGLRGQPTLINNVETFALATAILAHGVDWWQRQGQRGSAGIKFISISGDVRKPGVYEIPLGTTVRELIELAGGLPDGCQLQAFLPGGASSNFLSADKIDVPIDFDQLKAAGSMLGSGAVVIIGSQHSLFDLALNLVTFFRNESCGKCVPCRLGTEKAVQLLQDVKSGVPFQQVIDILRPLGQTMEQTSICGLGQVALNPILSLWANIPRSNQSTCEFDFRNGTKT